jgi:excisionase family DNA binding protein
MEVVSGAVPVSLSAGDIEAIARRVSSLLNETGAARDEFMTLTEVMEMTGYSRPTLLSAIRAGDLRAARPTGGRSYRILRRDVNAWMASGQ